MSEATFTKQCELAWRRMGANVVPYVASERNLNGFPDRIVMWRGVALFIELKGAATMLRPVQVYQLQEIERRLPRSAWVVRELPAGGCSICNPVGLQVITQPTLEDALIWMWQQSLESKPKVVV